MGHKLGRVQGWRGCFGARCQIDGDLAAICTVGRPVARNLSDEEVVEITRFASIPSRPANTGSWLISFARDWAYLEGYSKIIAYSGVAGNDGTLYSSLGFKIEEKSEANGKGWTSHSDDRETWNDYERVRWSYVFEDRIERVGDPDEQLESSGMDW